MRGFRLLCAAIVGAVCAGFPVADAQALLKSQGEVVLSLGIPSADEPEVAETITSAGDVPPAASVQAVWDLTTSGAWADATGRLAALKLDHPQWSVPRDLSAHLAAGQREARLKSALEGEDWQEVLAQLPPAIEGHCEPARELWARADALQGLGATRDLESFFVRTLTHCTDPDLVASLAGRSLVALDAAGLETVSHLPALERASDPQVMGALEKLRRADQRNRFDTALKAGDLKALSVIADTAQEPGLLSQAGWTFVATDAARAGTYFERALAAGAGDDARRGLAMARLNTDDLEGAHYALAGAESPAKLLDVAARIDLRSAEFRRAAGDWKTATTLADRAASMDPALTGDAAHVAGGALLDAAEAAYDQGEFAQARRLAERATVYPPTRRAAQMRMAWSDLQSGETTAAATTFRDLYTEHQDAESAQGYSLAAARTGELEQAASLARALGGPLGAEVNARYASAAFETGDYLTARYYAPASYADLVGLDGPWVRQGVTGRDQAGTNGEGALAGIASVTSIGMSRGADRFEAGVSVYSLDARAPGSRGAFAAPYLAWSREGQTSLAARVGVLPVGGDADMSVSAELAAAHEHEGRVIEGRVFSRPKTDSLRAFAGQEGADGTVYGRVSESGVSLRARVPARHKFSLQAELGTAHLSGQSVNDNAMVSAGISASRAIEVDGFAYLATGPFYQFQSYDRNTNFFVDGHAGYFSPQAFHRAGWSLNGQTSPLKDWMVKADAAIAYESVEEDAAPANPLWSGSQPVIGGGRNTGVAGSIGIAAARRVSRSVIFSADLSATASKAYEDFRLGLALTWVPRGRAGLVRGDLPADPFAPSTWIQP